MGRRRGSRIGTFGLVIALAAGGPVTAARPKAQVLTVPGFADFLAVDGKTVWATNRGRVEQWPVAGKQADVAMTRPCGAMAGRVKVDETLKYGDINTGVA